VGSEMCIRDSSIALLLGIVGACFLLRQALSAFRGALDLAMSQPAGAPSRGDFVVGTFFSMTNPFAVAFWLGLGAGVTATAHTGLPGTIIFFAGFFVGAVFWCVGFAAAVSRGRRYVNARLLRAIDALCGLALSYFGLRLLWQSLRALRLLRFARALVG